MSKDEFTKLFTYLESRLSRQDAIMNAGFKHVNARIDSLYGLIDSVIKENENCQQERLLMWHALDKKVDKIEAA